MNYPTTSPPRSNRRQERGQILVMAVLFLTVLLGSAGLAVDTGMLYTRRTNMQNATDSAAMAAAETMAVTGNRTSAVAAATAYMQSNGFTEGVGGAHIVVDNPPTTGPHAGDSAYFEVKVSASVPTLFLKLLGTKLSDAASRSVAGVNGIDVLPYNFVALHHDAGCGDNHMLLIKVGGTLTVDGGIYVNSCNNHDGFDEFGAGGSMTAKEIRTVGGWETHNGDLVCLEGHAACCALSSSSGGVYADCPTTLQPILADPFASLAAPVFSSYTIRHGTAAAPSLYTISSGTVTLQPGVYYGGLDIKSTAQVTLSPGVYIMGGGGLAVLNSATLSGDGVLIYNSVSGSNPPSAGQSGPVLISTTGAVTLKPQRGGPYGGMVIFQDRNVTENTILHPGSTISGLSGTVYTPGWTAGKKLAPSCPNVGSGIADGGSSTVVIDASGTANLQIISAQILVCAADATFHFDPTGLGGSGLSLVE
ncbi:MAG: Tad domain-containing protein [Chloroflexota bacterium]|nr:Tad domain-containing protein [Chloroflexota bacterium]